MTPESNYSYISSKDKNNMNGLLRFMFPSGGEIHRIRLWYNERDQSKIFLTEMFKLAPCTSIG